MIWAIGIFLALAIVTWRLIRTSYNPLAHWLNSGANNAEITQESELGRLLGTANRYFMERKWKAAEKAYVKVLKHDHKNITAFRRLGLVYSYLHEYADAAECCEYVIKRQPTAVDLQNYATVLYHQRQIEQAITMMQRALELEPSLSRYIGLAKLYQAEGEDDKQLQALLAANETSRGDETARKLIAQWYRDHGQESQADSWRPDTARG